jgi:hypothetical protein
MKLSDAKAYLTDLNVQSMRRAEAFHNSTEEGRGPWIADGLTVGDVARLMKFQDG